MAHLVASLTLLRRDYQSVQPGSFSLTLSIGKSRADVVVDIHETVGPGHTAQAEITFLDPALVRDECVIGREVAVRGGAIIGSGIIREVRFEPLASGCVAGPGAAG